MRVRPGILTALAAGLFLLPGCETQAPEGRRVGDLCPEIAGADPAGKPIKLSDYRGKVVLVNFWATWCRPCRQLIPHEREMVEKKYRDRPFVLLGVALDDAETLGGFLKANPLPWPNIADGQPGITADQWDVTSVPSALLIDHRGVIRRRWLDGLDPDAVWKAVDELVDYVEHQ